MLGIFEAQRVGHLRHRQTADHHALGTVYQEVLDNLHGTVARDAAHHVAEIAGREAQFRGAVFHVGQSVLVLQPALVVVRQHPLESAQQVALLLCLRLELALVEQQAVVADEHDVVLYDAVGHGCLSAMADEAADHLHQPPQQLFLAVGGVQRLVHIIRKKVVVRKPLLEHGAAHELRIEQQHPAVIHLAVAVVGLADDLSRSRCRQRPLRGVVAAHAVRRANGKVILHEDGIHAQLVQRVANLAQLVEVYDAHHRMKDLRPHILGVVIGVVDVEEIIYAAKVHIFTRKTVVRMKKDNLGRFSNNSDMP